MQLHKGIKGEPQQKPTREGFKHQTPLPDQPRPNPSQAEGEEHPQVKRVAGEPREPLIEVVQRLG